MRRWLPALAVLFLTSHGVEAAPGDPRIVQGTLEWPANLGSEPFVVLRGDDGRMYYADISAAQRRTPGPLSAGTRVAVAGIESVKPHEISAMSIGAGDLASQGFPAPAPSGAPGSAAAGAPPENLWRIDGTVHGITPTTVTLRDSGGRTFTVDVSQLSARTRQSFRQGETITLFGVPQGNKLVANGFIQSEPPAPAASPASPRR